MTPAPVQKHAEQAREPDPYAGLARALDAIAADVRAGLGTRDRAYVLRVIAAQRHCRLGRPWTSVYRQIVTLAFRR